MRPYRCLNDDCGTWPQGLQFFADKPVCPKCEAGEDSGLVMALSVIHFDPPSKVRGRGVNRLACDPKKTIFGRLATAHAAAVTCWACRETEPWKRAVAQMLEEV